MFRGLENWNIEALTGYKPISTFYTDFSIAEVFGGSTSKAKLAAIKDTYNRAFNEWKKDYKMLTEFVMVLNWKCNRWYEDNEEFANLYYDLYEEASQYAENNLKGDELSYYFRTTD